MTQEETLHRLAYYWHAYRASADNAFAAGRPSVSSEAGAHSMARQYMRVGGLKSTDEAVAEIRKRKP